MRRNRVAWLLGNNRFGGLIATPWLLQRDTGRLWGNTGGLNVWAWLKQTIFHLEDLSIHLADGNEKPKNSGCVLRRMSVIPI